MMRDLLQTAPPSSLRDPRVAEQYYDERYKRGYMDDGDWSSEKQERIARLLAAMPLPRTGRVLDFGCGTGIFTKVLRSALPNWEVTGTDISAEALERARMRSPECRFFHLSACEALLGRVDLVFSHHVLEHVYDLHATARTLANLLTPSGAMFHILPCGNPGSLAHRVCMLTRDGIAHDADGRFFFEEDGHLRRLTTEGLVSLWATDGLTLKRAYYAEQFVGAIRSLTQFDMRTVLHFANPKRARTASDALPLYALRLFLVALWLVRRPVFVLRNKRTFGVTGARDLVVVVFGLLAYAPSKVLDWLLRRMASREWRVRCHDRRAGEMYLFLVRGSPET